MFGLSSPSRQRPKQFTEDPSADFMDTALAVSVSKMQECDCKLAQKFPSVHLPFGLGKAAGLAESEVVKDADSDIASSSDSLLAMFRSWVSFD